MRGGESNPWLRLGFARGSHSLEPQEGISKGEQVEGRHPPRVAKGGVFLANLHGALSANR